VVQLPGTTARRVLVDGTEVAQVKPDDEKGAGWRIVDGAVTVRLRDRATPIEVRAEF
jgi:hypothetical protein